MSIILNDGFESLAINYADYKNGKYNKPLFLTFEQFCKINDNGKSSGFETDKDKKDFLYRINNLLNQFVRYFRANTDDCVEYAEQISDITRLLLLDDADKEMQKVIEDWAITEYSKMNDYYVLKMKVAFEDLMDKGIITAYDVDADGYIDEYSFVKGFQDYATKVINEAKK
nr:hypothetical protein [uncultured Lachnoclostridium sp.]